MYMKFFNVWEEFLAKEGLPPDRTQTATVLYNVASGRDFFNYGEIGSYMGRTASIVAYCNPQAKINCFDCPNNGWGGRAGTEKILAKAMSLFAHGRHEINLGNSHSPEIIEKIKKNGPYDLFLVDGDHSVGGCRHDFEVVWDCVNSGGIIVIDDLTWHPELGELFDVLVKERGITVFEKFTALTEQEKADKVHPRGVGVIYK